ncbi:MAG: hypothetical protein WC445_01075 [Patescibacteria group bacterium]
MTEQELRKDKNLVLCSHCDTPASWDLSCEAGWVGCAPCITGEAASFDPGDLIAADKDCTDSFLEEFNKK